MSRESLEGALQLEHVDARSIRFSVRTKTAIPGVGGGGAALVVSFNGIEHVCALVETDGEIHYFAEVQFAFAHHLVERFEVTLRAAGRAFACTEQDSSLEMMFVHSPATILGNVQRRGALKSDGRTVQLVCSWQSYLWARSAEGLTALGSAADQLRAESVSLCSVAYRMMQGPSDESLGSELTLMQERAAELTARMNLDSEDARWFPSVLLAVGQLCLTRGLVEEGIDLMRRISDNQERVLRSSPICAFNISLANCLLCAIFDLRRSKEFATYIERWQFVFRFYPPHMDIRFGTMEEFGKIYEAVFLNYKLQLAREKCKDKRFKPATFEEILEACLRVNVGDNQKRKVREWVLAGESVPEGR